jgi:hypothetical protein
MEESDSEKVIGSWVENTLQIRVTNTTLAFEAGNSALRIPYK